MKRKEWFEQFRQNTKKLYSTIKRIFPYWKAELGIFISFVFIIGFAWTTENTATITKEMEAMNSVFVVDDENHKENEQQSDFSINNPEYDEPIVTLEEVTYQTSQMCFIGNQIFSSMQNVLLTDAKFVSDANANITWFNDVAKSQFDALGNETNVCIVSLGLNDLDKASDYITSMNDWATAHEDKLFVFVNVAPVDESKYKDATNEKIDAFNKKMSKGLNEKWQIIDLYQYVEENQLQNTDGVNYSIIDVANIFSWVVDSVTG